mmetsp:Transcript_22505/g.52477  ORF Transcript_22505/g.52477 Transcript_22505/m.52477 type:complete len:417 (+) Transcript_22505:3299-4549(+)
MADCALALEQPQRRTSTQSESVNDLSKVLALPKLKVALVLQRKVQHEAHSLLGMNVEVDEEVAAGDEVDVVEGRVHEEVMLRKEHHVPDGSRHFVPGARTNKVASKSSRTDILRDRVGVHAVASVLQTASVDVRCKDLHLDRDVRVSVQGFLPQDREGVSFFPCRAARAPASNLRVLLGTVQDCWHCNATELLPHRHVTEEMGDTDETFLVKQKRLLLIVGHHLVVRAHGVRLSQPHPNTHTPPHSGRLVVREINTADTLDVREDSRQSCHLLTQLGCVVFQPGEVLGSQNTLPCGHGPSTVSPWSVGFRTVCLCCFRGRDNIAGSDSERGRRSNFGCCGVHLGLRMPVPFGRRIRLFVKRELPADKVLPERTRPRLAAGVADRGARACGENVQDLLEVLAQILSAFKLVRLHVGN